MKKTEQEIREYLIEVMRTHNKMLNNDRQSKVYHTAMYNQAFMTLLFMGYEANDINKMLECSDKTGGLSPKRNSDLSINVAELDSGIKSDSNAPEGWINRPLNEIPF